LILMPDGFLPAVFFTLVGSAGVESALCFPLLLIEGPLPEPLATAAAVSATRDLLETGTAEIGSSDPSSWPRIGAMKLSSAYKESGLS
jgi:hypothetical protein